MMYADNLREIQLANFKSFSKPAKFPIRPITLIFGPNSSGKSSFIQSMLFLKQSLVKQSQTGLRPTGTNYNDRVKNYSTGPLVNLGNYKNFVFEHDEKNIFSVSFTFDLQREGEVPFRSFFTPLLDARPWGPDPSIEEVHNFLEFLQRFETMRLVICFGPDKNGVNTLTKTMEVFLGKGTSPLLTYSFPMDDNDRLKANIEHPFWKEYWRTFISRKNHEDFKKYLSAYASFDEDDILDFIDDEYELIDNIRMEAFRQSGLEFDEFFKEDIAQIKKYFHNLKTKKGFEQAREVFRINALENRFINWVSGFVFSGNVREMIASNIIISRHDALIALLTQHLAKILGNLSYLGPFRELPSRHYIFDEESSEIDTKGANMPAILFRNPGLLEQINNDLELFGQDYQLKVVEYTNKNFSTENIYSLQLINKHTGLWSSFADVGFGFSQLLPMIALLRASEGRTIMIEQPELHLHPAMQAELGDLIINSSLDGERDEIKNSLIIETHSEHLILRILRRIRETSAGENNATSPITPEDVSVLYVQPGKAGLQRIQEDNHGEKKSTSPPHTDKDDVLHVHLGNNGSRVIHIPVTEDGEFERPWPNGFFAERAKELF